MAEISLKVFHSTSSSASETKPPETFTTNSISSGAMTNDALANDGPSANDCHYDQDPATFVKIPDMFSSIMSIDPPINPHYRKVKSEADAWFAMLYNMDEKMAKFNAEAEFALLSALWAPHANEEDFRTVVDWNNWIFLFDDQFDEGYLSNDVVLAQQEIDANIAIMSDEHPPISKEEYPSRYAFQTIWKRLLQRSGTEQRERLYKTHKAYFDSVLRQVEVQKTQEKLTVDEYMEVRRHSIGAMAAYSILEHACGISISQSVLDHPSIIECEKIAADLLYLDNDVLSLSKDVESGVEHNLIILLKKQGLSEQEALDKMDNMFGELYKRWYRALAEMPVWGEEIDREVLKYLDTCRNVSLGNLHWSYKSGRYLKGESSRVRATRIMNLSTSM